MKSTIRSDVFNKAKRSEVMSRIRGRGNRTTELSMINLFRRHGITGWRRNQPVFGKPDFIFRKMKVAVFVDGCFWHGCPGHYRQPQTRKVFWESKINRNKKRDLQVNRMLRRNGWRVLRIWEHAFQNETKLIARLGNLRSGTGALGG